MARRSLARMSISPVQVYLLVAVFHWSNRWLMLPLVFNAVLISAKSWVDAVVEVVVEDSGESGWVFAGWVFAGWVFAALVNVARLSSIF